MRKTFPSRKKPKRRDPTRAALFLIAAVVGAGTVLSALFRTRPETFEAVPAAEVVREKASPENPETTPPPRSAPKAPSENIPKKTPAPAAVPKKTPKAVPAAKIPAPAPKTPKPAPQKPKAKSKPAPANPYANVPALFGYGADMPPATRAFDASVELLAQRRDFSAFAAALGEKIKDAAASASLIRKGNLNAATFRRLSNLKRAAEICRVIDMAGTENLERFFRLPPAAAGTQADRIRADFLRWFFSSRKNGSSPVQKFLYAFYENGGDPRNADHAVRKLFELWTGTPEDDREPYANLMLAFALAHPSVEHARSRVRDVLRLGRRDPELAAFSLQIDRKYRFPTNNPAWETAMKRKELRVFKHTLDGTRGDLLLRVLEIQAADYKAKNDLRGLAVFYRRLMKENADRGDVFQAIFRQYQSFISGESDAVLMRAAKDAEAVFNKKIRTKTEEHFRLAKETSIQHIIADAYENAGAEKKAERLRGKADKRLQESAERYED